MNISVVFFGIWFTISFVDHLETLTKNPNYLGFTGAAMFSGFVFIGFTLLKLFAAYTDANLLLKMQRKKIVPANVTDKKLD